MQTRERYKYLGTGKSKSSNRLKEDYSKVYNNLTFKNQGQDRIIKTVREEKQIMCKGAPIYPEAGFLMETLQPGGE